MEMKKLIIELKQTFLKIVKIHESPLNFLADSHPPFT